MFSIRTLTTLISVSIVWLPVVVLAQSTSYGTSGWSPVADINQMREDAEASFDLLDHDNNNRITLDEIDLKFDNIPTEEQSLMRRRAEIAQQKFMSWDADVDRFEVADTNHDGVLDRDEYDNEDAVIRTHMLQIGLDELDEDKNGSINLVEFSAHLDALEELDEDGDGKLSRQEAAKSKDSSVIKEAWMASYRAYGRKTAEYYVEALDATAKEHAETRKQIEVRAVEVEQLRRDRASQIKQDEETHDE